MEIGISTGIIYNYNLLENLFLIKEAGFDVIEMCFKSFSSGDEIYRFDYQNWLYIYEIKNKLESYGLKVYSAHAPYGTNLDLCCLNEECRINCVFEIKNIINVLRFLDGSILVVHPTVKEMFQGSLEERNNWVNQAKKSLEDILTYAEKKGIKIAIENLLPHFFLGDLTDLMNLVSQFDSKNLGICLDTSHANLNKGV